MHLKSFPTRYARSLQDSHDRSCSGSQSEGVGVMEEGPKVADQFANQDPLGGWLEWIRVWFTESVATTETAIEMALIAVAGIAGWLIARRAKIAIKRLGDHHSRSPLLERFWSTLGKIAFPLFWVAAQWLIILAMSELGERHSAIVVTSSLLTAWIVVSIATVFVANPLWSSVIATFAWVVAALNILGLFEDTVTLLNGMTFGFGELNISALAIVQGMMALAVLLWMTELAGQLIEGRIRASKNLTPSIQVLATKLIRMALALVALLFTLSIVGIDLTAFAVLGGAIGVGLGFGLQKIFANLVSGFILLLDKSIKPGDVIAIGADYGKVDALGARYVSVLTRDGIEHLIPNEELITTKVENWTHSQSLLRIRKTIGVHYKSDIHKAMALCLEAADETPRILKDPAPVCLLTEFADSSVNLEVRFWIDDPMNGRSNVVSPLLLAVWEKFHANGIEIPYPQRDLHLRSSALAIRDGEALAG